MEEFIIQLSWWERFMFVILFFAVLFAIRDLIGFFLKTGKIAEELEEIKDILKNKLK